MNFWLKHIFIALALLFGLDVLATHNRAGEITYEHIEGFTYSVKVRICVDAGSDVIREYIPMLWGDGSPQDSIARTSGPLDVPDNPSILENYYVTTHTFNGPASYEMLVEDPNRNSNINNIENSVDQVFSLRCLLVISSDPNVGFFNNSIEMFNPPKGDACSGSLYLYNPLAFDPDGDSLAYELVIPTGNLGEPIPQYTFPDFWAPPGDPLINGPLDIDVSSGLISWDTPEYDGEYNIAIKISEYRNGTLVGYVIRDMQIRVIGICDNNPPMLDPVPDTCIVAGSNFSAQLSATDDENPNLDILAFGEPLELAISPAVYSEGTALFSWSTVCDHARLEPYEILMQVGDNSPQVELFDFSSFNITVIAPAVDNLIVTTEINDATITWDPNICSNASGYKIYRRIGMFDYVPDYCETGIPESTGYILLDNITDVNNTLYIDENIPFGNDVCYRIVACFPDGSESIVSEEACARIDLEIPVISKVSVGVTNEANGADTVKWMPPLELNTTDFPGPYRYELYSSEGTAYPNELIFTSTDFGSIGSTELTFINENIDTENTPHRYRVEFYNDDESIATSYASSSIFLSTLPDDNEIQLNWTVDVEWFNNMYFIYRSEESAAFELLDSTTTLQYLDSGLTNNTEYCYYVISRGSFDDPLIPFDIINYSQINCNQPWDQTPPCAPILSQEGICEDQNLGLSWNNPNESCADDVTEYNIYYAPTPQDEYVLLENIKGDDNTEINLSAENFVGCFLITALDSLFENPFGDLFQNESAFSDTLCIDGCPLYELPNVITVNGDLINDQFEPFPYLSIKDIDMNIYNRWGQVIFNTSDPNINWDGTAQDSGELVSDGVYYYVVQVNQITLEGIVPKTISGYLHLLDSTVKNPE